MNADNNVEEEEKEEKTEKKGKVEKEEEKSPGRDWTLSIALPGSILDNAQSPELRYELSVYIRSL